ncbi:2-keto-4-pentenoate hydratase [Achromobacter insolitus]|uniref:2-keto-4-pentenoate hydratase n=1 Tax=Achromobacter insolitus TaxID=217204 RepID=UPI000972CF27|nr:fumarylacetoacetate hydrolase family protein [Achromobacter insolitus]APX75606.1 2-keto-4-pentenoate hydratase [Achromobacter insolitus]OWT59777.1 2-keto-4-pentenoate hydratase [Achromobacter insolitus]CAB3704274.1 2-keto-4-pentenoate hydratase [Achromobacter insolitus]VEG67164.1 2-keto-4-pentenoate hydratase [Achromobacter insolitus]
MDSISVLRAADALYEARRSRTAISPISETFGIAGAKAAYEVAAVNTQRALREGRRVSGRKIGLTSESVQRQLGVDQPDFGVLFADMEYVSGANVPVSTLMQPKAEGEVAMVLGRDLDADLTWGRFLNSIEYVLPAIEIVDSAIRDWRITLADTVADNASCGLYVLGTDPKRLTDVSLRDCSMRFLRDGDVVSKGNGGACLGHPLLAAWWLARKMAELGESLRAGEVVLSGALGPMVPIGPGDCLHLEVGGLGSVSCQAE